MLLVLGYHAGVPWLSGGFVGVDVFFVISGFLITGLVVREIEATGRLDLRRFWARRARRLLPAAAVTLVGVAVMTVALLPYTRWPTIAGDVAASAGYVVNWRLASDAVDYMASEAAPSPVQHFWSLAVEEQFYIIWPLVIVGLIMVARRRGWTLRRTLFMGVAVLGIASLVWSGYLTNTDPGRAYFVSTTRVWELAIGAGLAIVAPRLLRLSAPMATVLGWGGLAAIMLSAVAYDSATPFPGVTALLPTLGAAAIITAGIQYTSLGVDRVLSVSAMQDIGTLSYSLYLWHWPVLVAATAMWGRDDGTLALPTALMAVGFSAVPAWFTYRVFEAPIHHGQFFRTLPRAAVLGGACTAVGIAAALVVGLMTPAASTSTTQSAEEPTTQYPGAAVFEGVDDPASVLEDLLVDESTAPIDPVAAVEDNADIYADGCHQDQMSIELISCTYGDADAETVIALVGDSHAGQWQPALVEVAEEHGWRLETYTKSACGFFTVDVVKADGSPYESCTGWNTNLREHLTGPDGPDVAIAASSVFQKVLEDGEVLEGEENVERLGEGMRNAWLEVENGGVQVVMVRDTPRLPFEGPECVAEHPDQLTECVSETNERFHNAEDMRVAAQTRGISIVDPTSYICPDGTCPGVIGNVIVWRDRHHLTATYAQSLAPFWTRELMSKGIDALTAAEAD